MSKQQQQLLIFGAAAPSRSPAAILTTQAVLTFDSVASVTLVLSDYAPPAEGYPESINVIRERDFLAAADDYKTAARLYILDDSYESLFALRLLRLAPGPWINADTTLHNLIRADFKSAPNWPEAYRKHMHETLGEAGLHIGHSLSGTMRVSKVIASEIESIEAIGSSELHIPLSNQELALPFSRAINESLEETNQFAVAAIGNGCTTEAVETLKALDKNVELRLLNGSEPNLHHILSCTDALCILDKRFRLPPAALSTALATGTAFITAGQPWVRHLPKDTRLDIPHSDAHHHLVAALGSLIGESNVKSWLRNGAKAFAESFKTDQTKALMNQILEAPVSPFDLQIASGKPEKTSQVDDKNAPEAELTGAKRPIALIGAVPPRLFVEQLCPAIDWENSPRFATPELAEALGSSTGIPSKIVLSLMGYEAPLIGTIQDWNEVKSELLHAEEAVTFDCSINGLPRVQSPTTDTKVSPQPLVLDFKPVIHEDFQRQTESGLLEHSGTYWHINSVEERIDCLIISGMPGDYRLSISAENTALVITDEYSTSLVQKGKSAFIKTDERGIIKFSIGAAHPVNYFPLTCEAVLKTLATTPLNLEWCTYG